MPMPTSTSSRPITSSRRKAGLAARAGRLVLALGALVASTLLLASPPAEAQRIKDIVDVEGVRENMLVGYGLVVGLNGTGDGLTNSPFTTRSLQGMFERLGINIRDDTLKTKNVAAVMVTATLPAFAQQGTRVDVTVSAMGDAKDLMGGTLLVTPLMGADGEVYAVAQGNVATGGFTASGAAATVTKGVPTSGRIASGAIVEREIAFDINDMNSLRLSLRNPDFTTAERIAQTINGFLGQPAATAKDPGTVVLNVPAYRRGNVVGLMTDVEQLHVTPDQIGRVVIDEKNGVIVMGENVRISTVAIAIGTLTITVTETPQVSQPSPFSQNGDTTIVPRTQIEVDDGKDKRMAILNEGITLRELVQGLNALGVGPRDMITILQSIKAAGALQAEIEVL